MNKHLYFIEEGRDNYEVRRRNKEDTRSEHVAFIEKHQVDRERICDLIQQANSAINI